MPRRPDIANRQRCKGIDVHTDPRKKPLTPCRGHAEPGKDYCPQHQSQAQRQDRLRAVLKAGWPSKLVAKRGRSKKKATPPKPRSPRPTLRAHRTPSVPEVDRPSPPQPANPFDGVIDTSKPWYEVG